MGGGGLRWLGVSFEEVAGFDVPLATFPLFLLRETKANPTLPSLIVLVRTRLAPIKKSLRGAMDVAGPVVR